MSEEIRAIDLRDARLTEIRRRCDLCKRRGFDFFCGYYLCRLCLRLALHDPR
jgi:hypothetical protein